MDGQVKERYKPNYANRPRSFAWRPASTLFVIFIGINDIVVSKSLGRRTPNAEILKIYRSYMDEVRFRDSCRFLTLSNPAYAFLSNECN